MLVMKKKKNLSESVNYQNAGPKVNFLSVISHARDLCFVTSCMLQINGCGRKSNAYS